MPEHQWVSRAQAIERNGGWDGGEHQFVIVVAEKPSETERWELDSGSHHNVYGALLNPVGMSPPPAFK